jgi:LPPG:FO 2-phospho-L-lactate transferase
MSDRSPHVVVICGGVGAARYLRGLLTVVPASSVTAIVNVADDMVLHGLNISPDLDTIMYTLAGEIDPERGWGLRNETWAAMETLGRYGDRNWFNLGDRDLGTHLHRTGRLSEGASLTEVTAELAAAWELGLALLPVSDDPIRTMVTTASDGAEIGFQQYFVGQQHSVPISAVRFADIERARPTTQVLRALADADAIVVAPSNPIVSIAPVLDVPGVRQAIIDSPAKSVAVSPIIGGAALKGPAANMLTELGHEASAVGVAALLAPLIDTLVIDDADAGLAQSVADHGVIPWVTDTIMSGPERSARLAATTLAAAHTPPGARP